MHSPVQVDIKDREERVPTGFMSVATDTVKEYRDENITSYNGIHRPFSTEKGYSRRRLSKYVMLEELDRIWGDHAFTGWTRSGSEAGDNR